MMNIKDKFFKTAIFLFLLWLYAFLWLNLTRYEIYQNGSHYVKLNRINGRIYIYNHYEAAWKRYHVYKFPISFNRKKEEFDFSFLDEIFPEIGLKQSDIGGQIGQVIGKEEERRPSK